jgi:hypothetical protein
VLIPANHLAYGPPEKSPMHETALSTHAPEQIIELKEVAQMTGKTTRDLALDAIDQALAESIRRQFISLALADPVDDGGTPLAMK